MKSIVIIGKNFGDEGKGLATDYFCSLYKKVIGVRHNGGAQSGHTVEYKKPKDNRFVFHELSSGSFCGASTLWADTFYPDLLKLGEEIEKFQKNSSVVPHIYAMENTCITIPDDILINMAIESSRGKNRHGSCGMGINECDIRKNAGYGICFNDLKNMNTEDLIDKLNNIRNNYIRKRLKDINSVINDEANVYLNLLSNNNVIINAAETIIDNMKYVNVISEQELRELTTNVDALIFESGQGLLLDCDNKEYAPNVTASHTGLKNSYEFLKKLNYKIDEVVYVSRTYVTRHGAGKLPNECSKESIGHIENDITNIANLWQGEIRYASHESIEKFTSEISKDMSTVDVKDAKVSLFLTHLNETNNSIVVGKENISLENFLTIPDIKKAFNGIYISYNRYGEDVKFKEVFK